MLERERVVLREPLGYPPPVGLRAERLPYVEEFVQVGARLVRGAERDATVHEERVLPREAPVPHGVGGAHHEEARWRRAENRRGERDRGRKLTLSSGKRWSARVATQSRSAWLSKCAPGGRGRSIATV